MILPGFWIGVAATVLALFVVIGLWASFLILVDVTARTPGGRP